MERTSLEEFVKAIPSALNIDSYIEHVVDSVGKIRLHVTEIDIANKSDLGDRQTAMTIKRHIGQIEDELDHMYKR